jgi:hypothetical protein
VTLTADPEVGWDVAAWAGACGGVAATSPCTLDLANDVSVSARFEQILWQLSASVQGQGTVSTTPSGIKCRDNCSSPFADGTRVSLLADPDDGWRFSSWVGACAKTPVGQPCEVVVTSDLSVGAIFERIVWDLQVDVRGGGGVTSNPPGIDCPNDCSATYADGTQVTLFATADLGYDFYRWGGACQGTPRNQSCVLDAHGALTVTAEFILNVE